MRTRVWYQVVDQCEDTYYVLNTKFDFTEFPDWVAEDAAENYWSYHDGWDTDWPVVITLHESEDGPEVARFSVNSRQTRHFSADKILDKK